MLTELTIVDKIECLANGVLQIRDRHQILKDGEEIAASFHRHVLNPGDDLTGQADRVKAIAAAVWTDDVIAAYQASLPATEPESRYCRRTNVWVIIVPASFDNNQGLTYGIVQLYLPSTEANIQPRRS